MFLRKNQSTIVSILIWSFFGHEASAILSKTYFWVSLSTQVTFIFCKLNKSILQFGLFLVFFLGYNVAKSQTQPDTADYPYWIEMAQDPTNKFSVTERAFELYKAKHPGKHQGFSVFERWREIQRQNLDSLGYPLPENHNFEAWLQYNGGIQPAPMGLTFSGAWEEKGPKGLPVSKTNYPLGTGRINTFAFHPSDSGKIIIGAPAGGAWKTTDYGKSWTPMVDHIPSLGVSSIIWDWSNDQHIILGSGDRDFTDAPGLGIFTSKDGGKTWNRNTTVMQKDEVFSMIQNPVNPKSMIATSNTGIWRSYNAGADWKLVYGNANFKELVYKPGDTTIVYGCYAGHFWRSIDGGETWEDRSYDTTCGLPKPGSVGRMLFAVSEQFPSYVYVIVSLSNLEGVYLSTDNGKTFRRKCKANSPDILEGQMFYNLAMAPMQDSGHILYAGGINVWMSRDTGATWKQVGEWSGYWKTPILHADQHWMRQHPITKKLIVANDGGLFQREKNGTWTSLNGNLGISQIYRIGQSQLRASRVVAGYQDNGTGIFDSKNGSNPWTLNIGADGMECLFDPTDSTKWYGSIYWGSIYLNGMTPINYTYDNFPWITPYALHPVATSTIFISGRNVWRHRNINGTFSTGWENLTKASIGTAFRMHISRVKPNILYYTRGTNMLFRTRNNLANTVRWDTLMLPPSVGYVSDIETSYIDSNIIYAISKSNTVVVSYDFGKTWSNYGNGLPSGTVYSIVTDKFAKRGLYCGTAAGVYYRDSSMSSWVSFSDGLALNANIQEMEIYYDKDDTRNSRISAATYGRGLWQSPLYISSETPAADFTCDTLLCLGENTTLLDASIKKPEAWQWTISPAQFTLLNGTQLTSQNPQIRFNKTGIYTIKLQVKKEGYGFSTLTKKAYIKVVTMPKLTRIAGADSLCFGDSTDILVSGGSGSYSWSPNQNVQDLGNKRYRIKPSQSQRFTLYSSNEACYDSLDYFVKVNPIPSVSILGKDSFCAGSELQLKGQGATKYQWQSNTGVFATDSQVTLKPSGNLGIMLIGSSAGCVDTVEKQIVSVPLLQTKLHGPARICEGSLATLHARGGTHFSWFPLTYITNNTGNTANIKPDRDFRQFVVSSEAGFCPDTAFWDIDWVAKPLVSITPADTSLCEGSAVNLIATGGTQYKWYENKQLKNTLSNWLITANSSSTYTVVALLDTVCVDSAIGTVRVTAAPIKPLPSSISACQGDTIILDALNSGSRYFWNTGDTNQILKITQGNTYIIYLSKGPCKLSDSILAIFKTLPKPTISWLEPRLNTQAFTSYQWLLNGIQIPAAETQSHSVVENGYYQVRVIDSNGCENTSDSFLVTLSKIAYNIYPNPTGDMVTIEVPKHLVDPIITLYNAVGEKVLHQKVLPGKKNMLYLGNLSPGIYVVQDGKGFSARILKL